MPCQHFERSTPDEDFAERGWKTIYLKHQLIQQQSPPGNNPTFYAYRTPPPPTQYTGEKVKTERDLHTKKSRSLSSSEEVQVDYEAREATECDVAARSPPKGGAHQRKKPQHKAKEDHNAKANHKPSASEWKDDDQFVTSPTRPRPNREMHVNEHGKSVILSTANAKPHPSGKYGDDKKIKAERSLSPSEEAVMDPTERDIEVDFDHEVSLRVAPLPLRCL